MCSLRGIISYENDIILSCRCSIELPRPQELADRTTHYINSLQEVLCCGVGAQRTMGCVCEGYGLGNLVAVISHNEIFDFGDET